MTPSETEELKAARLELAEHMSYSLKKEAALKEEIERLKKENAELEGFGIVKARQAGNTPITPSEWKAVIKCRSGHAYLGDFDSCPFCKKLTKALDTLIAIQHWASDAVMPCCFPRNALNEAISELEKA